jgi:hypothetical protein
MHRLYVANRDVMFVHLLASGLLLLLLLLYILLLSEYCCPAVLTAPRCLASDSKCASVYPTLISWLQFITGSLAFSSHASYHTCLPTCCGS